MGIISFLKPGDSVEVIAPASRCTESHLLVLQELLQSWELNCILDKNIFGNDLLCANTDENRLASLKNALLNPTTKAIVCARGGYGSMRLLPGLFNVTPPQQSKLFIGMSDITALNLFLMQQWHWPVLHGGLSSDKFSLESIYDSKSLIFGEKKQISLSGSPLNKLAKKNHTINKILTGGNLSLIQTSIGTAWQVQGENKILFLEDVSERGYRIDRMLEHLLQANIFKHVAAVVLGDFLEGKESNGTSLVQPVLERFAEHCPAPVIQIAGIGHGQDNITLPLGLSARLQLGDAISLTISMGNTPK